MKDVSRMQGVVPSVRSWCAALVTVSMALVLAFSCPASGHAQLKDDPSLPIQERRDLALDWLDRYLTDSVLRSSDMERIRAAVLQMSPSQLEQWLAQTKDLRAYVESDRWQETRRWLRGYLRFQAIYTEAEIQKFRDDLVNADAQTMLSLLKRIQARHDQLAWEHEAAEKSRQIAVFNRDQTVAIQDAAAAAARAARATDQMVIDSGQAGAARSPRNRSGYYTPGALINSRDMSRAEVWAQVWGPSWYIGGF